MQVWEGGGSLCTIQQSNFKVKTFSRLWLWFHCRGIWLLTVSIFILSLQCAVVKLKNGLSSGCIVVLMNTEGDCHYLPCTASQFPLTYLRLGCVLVPQTFLSYWQTSWRNWFEGDFFYVFGLTMLLQQAELPPQFNENTAIYYLNVDILSFYWLSSKPELHEIINISCISVQTSVQSLSVF